MGHCLEYPSRELMVDRVQWPRERGMPWVKHYGKIGFRLSPAEIQVCLKMLLACLVVQLYMPCFPSQERVGTSQAKRAASLLNHWVHPTSAGCRQ